MITRVVIGDVDHGLSEILPMFCIIVLVRLMTGSCVSGSMHASDLVWFLIGLQVFGSHLQSFTEICRNTL